MARTAVVLFNLGGPDRPEAVQPFLFNLFNDPAIMRQPGPVRWLLARLISWRRAPVAREIYARIGGRSPILPETEEQAAALTSLLGSDRFKVFVCMRYWHPMTEAVVAQVRDYGPDHVVLLPLYPQFSTTTTASSFAAWDRVAARLGLDAPTTRICCYPDDRGFVDALAALCRAAIDEASKVGRPRVLFSAHGLPKKFVDQGDPYRFQVERTVAAVLEVLGDVVSDHVICFQSRVGPLEWLRPYTDEEIVRAAQDGVPVVVVPVAFVSEHSETLVELDIEYGELARKNGAPAYVRVPTVSADQAFIRGLADLVRTAGGCAPGTVAGPGKRICPATFGACPVTGTA